MATSVYHLIARHIKTIKRSNYKDIERHFIDSYINDTFSKLSWKHDVFDGEYLTKKSELDQTYIEVLYTLSYLKLNKKVLMETSLNHREYILKKIDLEREDVVANMRKRFYSIKKSADKVS